MRRPTWPARCSRWTGCWWRAARRAYGRSRRGSSSPAQRRNALAAGELLTEIRLPAAPGRSYAFEKFSRRALDWAVVGVAAQARPGGGVAIALIGMGPTPVRATAVEEALAAGEPAAEAARLAAWGCEPPDDAVASASYRAHLAEVLVTRALAAL
ncbi:hypothetical protein ACFSTC_22200 [Nonomuraea ferruginea]